MDHAAKKNTQSLKRIQIIVTGAVQGVGFRPFVYQLAHHFNLTGFVINQQNGVAIEVEGSREQVDQFFVCLQNDKPAIAYIHKIEQKPLPLCREETFTIKSSQLSEKITAFIQPDMATCPQCKQEIIDPNNRRYFYAFTNCTHCGPRYTIIKRLPYDRVHTVMDHFKMCPACLEEYHDPHNRRHHAQPNACPDCGPMLQLVRNNQTLALMEKALNQAAALIQQGFIIALKGLGGFQLLTDPYSEQAVNTLRERKKRPAKPFAVMVKNIARAHSIAHLSQSDEKLLSSRQAPIVLVKKKRSAFSKGVAPGNPYLGIMLPYTPLHHLLLALLDQPVIATSGNASNEPICITDQEALERLKDIADFFLLHNRAITRQADDSVYLTIRDKTIPIRRARGFAPLPLIVKKAIPQIFAAGSQLKNTIAFSKNDAVYLSPYIGSLEQYETIESYQKTVRDMFDLFDFSPRAVAVDLHPDYFSTQFARQQVNLAQSPLSGLPIIPVQHHQAHFISCLAENQFSGQALGVVWDGTGLGQDQQIWGSEFFIGNAKKIKRVAHLTPFPLPGGDLAARQPFRSGLGLLYRIYKKELFQNEQLPIFQYLTDKQKKSFVSLLEKGINSPLTTSMGRFFDGIASLIGLYQEISFEGQAAMAVEYLSRSNRFATAYPFEFKPNSSGVYEIDWQPMLRQIIHEMKQKTDPAQIAACFQQTLVTMIIEAARFFNQSTVALSGGCFQNRVLLEKSLSQLSRAGFKVLIHQKVPPNDSGISLGQIIIAAQQYKQEP